jgi:hypothetical protein
LIDKELIVMATWIAHLRVAENILNEGLKFDKIPFVVGNIGPDAGMPNEEEMDMFVNRASINIVDKLSGIV